MTGRFQEPVTAWSGATQGHEITGLMDDRIKIESLGFDPALVAFRADSIGVQLGRDVEALAHWATWAAAIRTEAMGRVTPGRWGTKVRFDLTEADLRRTRRAVRVLGELMFAAGAIEVSPGVAGWHRRVSNAATMARFEAEASTDPRAYSIAISHMFGTARMGSDPAASVVRPDFRHHAVDRLYVADASVFPTNTGVNPQISIMTMGACCGRSIMGASPPAVSRLASRVP
jgi:choline dehydrogenase-like flavoprotein